MRYAVLVEVTLRPGVADPEGATIERALPALGFGGVDGVRVGKAIRFRVDAPDEDAARKQVEAMCRRFLANPVIEDAAVSIEPAGSGGIETPAGSGGSETRAGSGGNETRAGA